MDCANAQKSKTRSHTQTKPSDRFTVMPSYQETVMESWYCYNDARIDIKSKEGNPQVEVMTQINLNL